MNACRFYFSLMLASLSMAAVAQDTNFVRVNPVGTRMISNPLLSTNNDVSNIFKNPPAWLTVFKRNVEGTGYDVSGYDPDIPGWTAPMSLVPGEGAYLFNPGPGNYTNTFYGKIVLCSTNHLPPGYSIRSQVYPSTVLTNFRPNPLDGFYFFNRGVGYDNWYSYDPDLPGWSPKEPSLVVGESFWIYNNWSARDWVICVSP